MDLGLSDLTVAVGGASRGLGRAVTERLLQEGARVIGIARSKDTLQQLAEQWDDRFIVHAADLTQASAVNNLAAELKEYGVYGVLFNSGGPPPGRIGEVSMQQWDDAYASTLRWKIQLTRALLPYLRSRESSSLLYLESVSIKQPIDNLVLSNTFRAAVAGFVKTLSREEGKQGIRANIIAPGYHATDRIVTVLNRAAELQEISREEVEQNFLAEVPLGALGQPDDLAALAGFLLSPGSRYISGQTITVDGGLTRFITG
jgi:3-oxoacyl-[acyl-carrier protein] reductase